MRKKVRKTKNIHNLSGKVSYPKYFWFYRTWQFNLREIWLRKGVYDISRIIKIS